jgi:hypothetical protein
MRMLFSIIPTLLLINPGILKLTMDYGALGIKNSPVLVYQTFMISLAIYAIFSFGGYFYHGFRALVT